LLIEVSWLFAVLHPKILSWDIKIPIPRADATERSCYYNSIQFILYLIPLVFSQ
jgi:hypothetical protein